MTSLNWRAYAMVGALLGIWFVFAVLTEGMFLSGRNLANLARQTAVTAVLAVGMVFVIASGQIDLSVGSLAGFLGACLALAHAQWGVPAEGALFGVMLLGALLGASHGFLTAYQGVPAFIVTLGGLLIYRGGTLAVTRGETIPLPLDSWLRALGNGNFPQASWGVPVPLWCVAILAAIFGFIGHWTRFGRHVYAVGGNVEAAYLSGVNTRRVVLGVFTLMGALTAIAGGILTSRVAAASPEAGKYLELNAIAACVIGGTSLLGGQGSIPGALVGALVMESLNNGMSLKNMGVFWQDLVRGTVLVSAVWFDVRVRQKGK